LTACADDRCTWHTADGTITNTNTNTNTNTEEIAA
jgi:hypothetical protein